MSSSGDGADSGTDASLRLLQAIAVAANEASSTAQAMQDGIDAICAYAGWPVGHFYAPAEDGIDLVPSTVWHLDDPERFEAFRRVTEALRVRAGPTLPGRVFAGGRPVWIGDLAGDPGFVRRKVASEAGIVGGFGFPVLSGADVVGVLEFFTTEATDPDDGLLDVVSQIGTQLGRVLERTKAAAAMREREEQMRLVIETAHDGFIAMDGEGTITDWNSAAEAVFGWSRAEAVGRPLRETIIPERYREAHQRAVARFLSSGEPMAMGRREVQGLHRDGHELPIELSVWPVRLGRTVQFNAFVHDVSERRRAEAAVRESKERFQAAFDNAPIGMVLVDLGGRILQANRAYREMLGYTEDALRALTVADLTHPDDVEASREFLRRAVARELTSHRVEKRYVHADGHPVWVALSVSEVKGPDGGIAHFIGQIQDISAQKEAEEKLTRQALHDPLTGLPNRSLLLDRLHQAVARSSRRAAAVTVLFLDLDNFKLVNDSLGHEAGDKVLVQVARRLLQAVRPTDTVCRFGGDEFVILCEGVDGEREAKVIAARVEAAVGEPCVIGDREARVTASVGLVLAGAGSGTPEALLRDADAAMYLAKGSGKARHEFFDNDLRQRARERARLERCLREALEGDELRLVYQPIVDLASRAMVGIEALLRYEDSERGVLLADEFIDVAEDSGLIIPLGAWVLERSLQDAVEWRRRGWTVPLTVNLGARQVTRPTLAGNVLGQLEAAGLDPAMLSIDLPEAALMEPAGPHLKGLQVLRGSGVRLGINDWGTGPASVSSLVGLPVDYVKIDRSVVAGIGVDTARTATVRALLEVGRAFDLVTIAGGVETAHQAEHLMELGCTLGQGNHLGPPRAHEVVLGDSRGAPEPAEPGGRG